MVQQATTLTLGFAPTIVPSGKRSMVHFGRRSPVIDRPVRFKADVTAVYASSDGTRRSCAIINLSSTGMALTAPDARKLGETIVVFVPQVGQVVGRIVRLFNGGFAIRFTGPPSAREEFLRRFRAQ